jgi:hypothetical protein
MVRRTRITTTITARIITANRRSEDLIVKTGFPQGKPVFFAFFLLWPFVQRGAPCYQLQVIGHLLPRAIEGAALCLVAALRAASDGFNVSFQDPNRLSN